MKIGKIENTCDVRIEPVRGHWEVYINDRFFCSADTYDEAVDEVEAWEEKKSEKAECDATTQQWFKEHPGAVTTCRQCERCGLWYKSGLGHKAKDCEKVNK